MQHMNLAIGMAIRHERKFLMEEGRLKEITKLKGQGFVMLRNIENQSSSQKERIYCIPGFHKGIGTVYGADGVPKEHLGL